MKTQDFIVETSLIAQEADMMHQDHEVQMARADCYNAAKYAIELHRILKDMSEAQGLDGWVSEKITLANDYLRTVAEYLRHEQAHNEDMMTFAEDAANYALDTMLNEDVEQVEEAKHFRTAYGWAGGRNEKTGKTYKHPDQIKADREAKKAEKEKQEKKSVTESYVGRETKDGVWRVFKTGQAVAVAGPFKSAAEASAWIKKQKKEVSEGQGRNSGKTTAQGGYYVVSGARAKKFATHKAAKEYSEKNGGDVHSAEYYHDMQQKKTVKESASAGGTGAAGIAVSMSGPAGKPGTGKPKKIGNAAQMKKVQVGKGVY